MPDPLRRVTGSLFTRLALILLLAAIAVNVVTYHLFFNVQRWGQTSLGRNLEEYAAHLVRELGSPPDRARAAELGKRLDMRITWDGPDAWAEGRNPGHFPEEHLKSWLEEGPVRVASLHGYHRIRVRITPGQTLTFDLFPTQEERTALRRYGWLFLGLIALIMLVGYGFMRHLLRPVRWLTEGARAVRDGDLAHRVPEACSGELRDLTQTFNQMLARLEGVVQGQQRLLLDVSHELRTPITRLKLRLELCGDGLEVEAMRGDLREMQDMITTLLEAARMRHEIGTLRREPADLGALAGAAAGRVAGRAPGVILRLPAGSVRSLVDPARVATLLGNLLDNALKYSDAGAAPVELGLEIQGVVAALTVRDHGVGIPAEALPHLFEPFFRVDESRTRETGGFGLGLALCQAIAHAHGGRIAVCSQRGWGTLVTVLLPLMTQEGGTETSCVTSQRKAGHGPGRDPRKSGRGERI